MTAKNQKFPMQPVVFDERGTIRFAENRIVRALLENSQKHGLGLNEIACMDFTPEEEMQLAQLIGYSVSGYGDLSYATDRSVATADKRAEKLAETRAQAND